MSLSAAGSSTLRALLSLQPACPLIQLFPPAAPVLLLPPKQYREALSLARSHPLPNLSCVPACPLSPLRIQLQPSGLRNGSVQRLSHPLGMGHRPPVLWPPRVPQRTWPQVWWPPSLDLANGHGLFSAHAPLLLHPLRTLLPLPHRQWQWHLSQSPQPCSLMVLSVIDQVTLMSCPLPRDAKEIFGSGCKQQPCGRTQLWRLSLWHGGLVLPVGMDVLRRALPPNIGGLGRGAD